MSQLNKNPIKSFDEVVKWIAQQYVVPEETVEAIICDYIRILYLSATGHDPKDDYLTVP